MAVLPLKIKFYKESPHCLCKALVEESWHHLSHEKVKKFRRNFPLQDSQCPICHLYQIFFMVTH